MCVCRDITDIYLVRNVTNSVCFYMSLYTFLCHPLLLFYSSVILSRYFASSSSLAGGDSRLWSGYPAADNPVPLSPTIFCARDPDAALNAGHRRLLTKLGERGGGGGVSCGRMKEAHVIKNSGPPVNASPLKTAGPGSCRHSATYKLILSLCRYRVTTPPLLPPFVGCFVRAP